MATIDAPIETTSLITLRVTPALEMTEEQFFLFCAQNDELRIERTAEGAIEIMPLTGGGSGNRNMRLAYQLAGWALRDGSGEAFDSSTGFRLPNGATRSPDASWVHGSRLSTLTPEQWERFLPLCPDFVLELRSPSDSLRTLQAKMREYLENGARLGWLFDPTDRRVYVYRPGKDVEFLDDPPELSAEPELRGFTLDLRQVWGEAA